MVHRLSLKETPRPTYVDPGKNIRFVAVTQLSSSLYSVKLILVDNQYTDILDNPTSLCSLTLSLGSKKLTYSVAESKRLNINTSEITLIVGGSSLSCTNSWFLHFVGSGLCHNKHKFYVNYEINHSYFSIDPEKPLVLIVSGIAITKYYKLLAYLRTTNDMLPSSIKLVWGNKFLHLVDLNALEDLRGHLELNSIDFNYSIPIEIFDETCTVEVLNLTTYSEAFDYYGSYLVESIVKNKSLLDQLKSFVDLSLDQQYFIAGSQEFEVAVKSLLKEHLFY